jgi:hypothetical protein
MTGPREDNVRSGRQAAGIVNLLQFCWFDVNKDAVT